VFSAALCPALLADADAKDVVVAILGASAGLGGLVLVFLGTIFAAYQSLPTGTTKTVRDRTKNAGTPIVGVFLLSIASVALSVIWLDAGGSDFLYQVDFVLFLVELAAIVLLAITIAKRVLK
jgi:hypothetical protein